MSLTGTLGAVQAANALITVAINGLMAAQKYQLLIAQAQSEGREVSDAELNQLQAENKKITNEILARLSGETNDAP